MGKFNFSEYDYRQYAFWYNVSIGCYFISKIFLLEILEVSIVFVEWGLVWGNLRNVARVDGEKIKENSLQKTLFDVEL